MFGSAVSQVRYGFGLLRGRIRPEPLTRISRDLVRTLAEFGTPGEDAAQLPGQGREADAGILRAQAARGLRLTAKAAGRTAYYRRLFEEHGIKADELTPENWAQSVPVTPKQALRGMPAAFVSDRAKPSLMAMTTGTTGGPTVVWFSADELEIFASLGTISSSLAEGLRARDVIAYANSSRASLTLLSTAALAERIGAGFVPLGAIDPSVTLEHLAAPIMLPDKAPQITRLLCSPSYLAALVGVAEAEGWQPADFGLERIQVGGEIFSGALKSRAEAVFGAAVHTGYMTTEIMPAGGGYCAQGHLHFPPEFGYVEFLCPDTWQPAAPGEIAVIVVTPYSAYRTCTTLLRYATGDLVRVLDGLLTCELAGLPACSDILGRYTGPLSIAVPTRSVLELLESEHAVPLPTRYCLTGHPKGPLLHVVVQSSTSALLARLEDRAERIGLELGGIVLHEHMDDLPVTPPPLRCDLREHSFDRPAKLDALTGSRP